MVSEVETILNEIRERVRADQEQRSAPGTLVVPHTTSAAPGDASAQNGSGNAESLNRLSAHLTTTTRAWDRLPPLSSNRTGMASRIELWIKARLKSLSRWFTWEQVNFNAAVHHALSDTLEALQRHDQELRKIRAEARNAEARLASFEKSEREIKHIEEQVADMRNRISETTAAQVQLNKDAGARISNMAKEIDERLAALAADLREEQRVCFKQLSLEAGESAVLEDRSRRTIESRLEKLEQAATTHED
jgi:flagellar biosynthesis GTPase FlhF